MKQFFFISGLPRAGTTLLSTILNQNPKFQASISGPLARFTRAIIEQSSAQGGYRKQCPPEKSKKIIHSVFDAYYDESDKEVFFDTNRGWTLLLPALKGLYPNTKVICCVRDIKWILDSFERLHRKNAFSNSSMFSPEENVNVYTRCQSLLREDRTLGFAYMGLKQAITSEEKNMIMLVEYDQLCKFPEKTMKSIYKFIGQEYYVHDFNDVAASYDEFDEDVNLPGLHTTRQKVEWIPREIILPPDIIAHTKNMEVWRQ